MGLFTFIPQWVAQDLIILVMAVIFIFFIIRKEFLAMLISLGILVTKYTSNFLLWLEPIMTKGSISEYIMMGFYLVFAAVLLLVVWRGRMLRNMSFKEELPVFLIFFVSHASNILFALIGNFREILWLQFLTASVQSILILFIYFRGRQFRNLNLSKKIPAK